MVQPQPSTQYHYVQRRAARKRVLFWLLAVVVILSFLALAFLFPEEAPDDIPALDATATAFAFTATAFAETFLATVPAASTLTRIFEQLRTAQPLLFPEAQPSLVTATPAPTP